MFNILVTLMTLIALGFVVLWWLRPAIRDAMEAPKYRLLSPPASAASKYPNRRPEP